MTEIGAERIAQMARETFGDQVLATVTRRPGTGPGGYAARLVHKQLDRHVAIGHFDDWFFLRAAWLEATGAEVRS